jgi:hypothetical protein
MAEFFPKCERDGFGSLPETFVADGSERILRAYSPRATSLAFRHGTSRRIGNCFFVPACGSTKGPIKGFSVEREKWTGAFLEERLNAFFWGNAYDRIGIWAMNPGTSYNIGTVGQNTRYDLGMEGGIGRYLEWTGADQSYFRQVTLNFPDNTTGKGRDQIIKELIRPVDDFAVVQPLSRIYGHA